MQLLTVKDLMVPKDQYARISADSTLGEAVLTLQEVQEREAVFAAGEGDADPVAIGDEVKFVDGLVHLPEEIPGELDERAVF